MVKKHEPKNGIAQLLFFLRKISLEGPLSDFFIWPENIPLNRAVEACRTVEVYL